MSAGRPTVVPQANFDSIEDAKALRKAMKGIGTDEKGLIAVLCHRSNVQIQQIKRDFKTQFGRDLEEDIKSETSGNFKSVLCALLTSRLDYYVQELHKAMAGVGTDEAALVEILCALSNYEMSAIKEHYKQVYGKHLVDDVISDTSGHFKRLLVLLCSGGRDESGHVDLGSAAAEAAKLSASKKPEESFFNEVLCLRNFKQIGAICDQYEQLVEHSLVKTIENEFSGDVKDGLLATLQYTSNKAQFFASRLHKSMAGIGTTDSQLIRMLVIRCEIDLQDVKDAFEIMYKKSLRSWIQGDTSGHYKHALYHLIGEKETSSM